MAKRYGSFTPARRAALRKAQAASARKRSRLGRVKSHVSRNRGRYAGLAGLAVTGAVLGSRSRSRRPHVSTQKKVLGSHTRSRVDRDAIPLYNPNANKNWPHVNADMARKKNKKLRKKGMIE